MGLSFSLPAGPAPEILIPGGSTAGGGLEGRLARMTWQPADVKPSVPAAHHAEHQRRVAENDGPENEHEFGQLMPAQIAR